MTIGVMLLTAAAAAGAFADATWPKNVQHTDDFYKAFKSTVRYERHDVDRGVVVSVAFTNGFDVGRTCDKTEGRKPGCGRTANSHVEIVPAAVYQRARVICTWRDDPKLEPTFTIRITRYNDASGYTGRAAAGVCDTEVDVRRAVKRKLPDGKWELFIPIDMGDHVDLVTWDRWGTYLNTGIHEGNGRATNIGNYIDVGFISCPARLRSQDGDPRSRMEPDPKRRSGVTVWGFELGRATVAFEPRQFVPGNVFANGDRQETEVDLHVLDYCKYEFELTEPDYTLPTMFGEYAVAELRKPIPLKGRPASIGMMVKGNSGWGKVGWVVEAPNGSRSVSLGGNASADVFDYQGAVSVAFSGWRFMRQIVDRERSSVIDSSMDGNYIWVPGISANADLKLVGIAFTAENRPLCLTERHPMRQVIRFKDIVTFDAGKAKR